MQDRAFRHAARTLMLNEQAPTLRIKDVDLTQYADKLIARFANPALNIRPGKSQWMVARNYRNVCWQVFAYIWARNGLVVAGIRRCWLDALRQRR
ncbi:mannitol dehydrogenase family protein [Escherichia coli]